VSLYQKHRDIQTVLNQDWGMHNKPWAAVLPERKLTAPNVKKKKKAETL
jgi:hypothetical protein